MSDPPLFWLFLLLFAASTYAASNKPGRTLHVLAGGHIRILNEDPNDTELLSASASGSGKGKKGKQDDDDRKTLTQQVADGKYALIQKELFSKPSKRPGVVSYESNSEVPKDNINNLGGLSKNDIWLAENHLLVVRGGIYSPHEEKQDNSAPLWPAIDDFKAPDRPVKIPAHPKIPPPFPVQLTDDGPLQILGPNSSRTINGTLDESAYPLPPPEGYIPGTGPFFPPLYPYPPNAPAGKAPFPNAPLPPPSGDSKLGAPFPPLTPLNGTLPPYFASLPPGAVILPPPNNITEVYDEDDPSIYYPPPYSFYYPKDNSTNIEAGPLVPGIILPPPPNFFAPLEDEPTTRKPTRPPMKSRIKTTTKLVQQIRPTTTPNPITRVIETKTTKKPTRIIPNHTPSEINNELNPVVTTTLTPAHKIVTVLPVNQISSVRTRPKNFNRQRKPTPGVTVLKPIITKTSQKPVHIKLTSKPVSIEATPEPNIYIYNNEVTGKPFAIYGPPTHVKKTTTTTQHPVKVYYTTSNEIESNSVTDLPTDFQTGLGNAKKPRRPANYYYYDDKHHGNRVTTPQAVQDIQDTLYYIAGRQAPPKQQQKQYYYVTSRPYNNQKTRYQLVPQTSRPDSFKVHVTRLQKQLQQYLTTPRPYRPVYSPKPVYQYSFQAANYQPTHEQTPIQEYQAQQNYQQQQQNYQQPQQNYQQARQNYQQLQQNYQQPRQTYQQSPPQQNYHQITLENLQQQAPQYYQQVPQQQQNYLRRPVQQGHRDFRTPKPVDNNAGDKFRPIPKYSVQIQAAVDLTPTEQPVYQNPPHISYQVPTQQQSFYQASSERPAPHKYYNQPKPSDYDYVDTSQKQKQSQQSAVTPRPVSQFSFGAIPNPNIPSNIGVTPNPVYQGYYTKPDEGYFDDMTKKYFTIFGQKVPNSTTPLNQIETSTQPSRPVYVEPQRQVQIPQNRPPQQQISLAGDTLVNYLQPRPSINPEAEFIEVDNKQRRPQYSRVVKFSPKPTQYVQNPQQNQQRQPNDNPEIVKAIPIRVPENNGQGSFISYELPGDDGAHFYFLTPQLAQRQDQGAGYYYSQHPNVARKRRQEREIDKEKDSKSERVQR